MTPIGRFAVASETPSNPSIVTCLMKFRNGVGIGVDIEQQPPPPPLSAHDFHQLWYDQSMAIRHPRFHQVVVPHQLIFRPEDPAMSKYHWIETSYPANRDELRKRLQYMQINRWPLSDSLWYMSVGCTSTESQRGSSSINNHNEQLPLNESVLLFRGHHALADGVSMMAAFTDLFDERDVFQAEIKRKLAEFQQQKRQNKKKKRYQSLLDRLWGYWVKMVKLVAASLLVLLRQCWLVALNALWDANPWGKLKALQRGADKKKKIPAVEVVAVERTVAWSDFAPLQDIRQVAKTLGASVTVNDIMVACATAALSKQLAHHRVVYDDELGPYQKSVHVTIPVHLKGGVILPNESVGNNIGAVVARVPCEIPSKNSEMASLYRLKLVHEELSLIKRTPGALVSYGLAVGLSWLSQILPLSRMFATAHAGTIMVVSNNRGPDMPLHVQGRELVQMYAFVPLPPGIPIGLVVQSYNGTVSCTVTAEPWAVPDGDQFLIWMMQEYKTLVQVANTAARQ
jgi:WS/DGAT C-terminal domain/Wax ester synthase-like Acyl-CoA acyltransferase domain